MKTYRLTIAPKTESFIYLMVEIRPTLWEEFIQYLDTIYFEGAAELLDKELVSFEYNAYLSCYGN